MRENSTTVYVEQEGTRFAAFTPERARELVNRITFQGNDDSITEALIELLTGVAHECGGPDRHGAGFEAVRAAFTCHTMFEMAFEHFIGSTKDDEGSVN